MSPNPLVLAKKVVTPHKWFSKRRTNTDDLNKDVSRMHDDLPIPGFYEHKAGRGWFLLEKDEDNGKPLEKPLAVRHFKPLGSWMLETEYQARKRHAYIDGPDGKKIAVIFFRCDEVSWIKAWTAEGEPIKGPHALWCIDQKTGKFRRMLKCDALDSDRKTSRAMSKTSEADLPSPAVPTHLESPGEVLCARCSAPASVRSTGPNSTRASSFITTPGTHSANTTAPSTVGDDDSSEFIMKLDERLKDVQLG